MPDNDGATASPIEVCDYNPDWPIQFEQLRLRTMKALGPVALSVEHIGSTAVPGLAAKPVIDIDVVVRSLDDIPEAVQRLAVIGYEHEGDGGIDGREVFRWPAGEPRHHLYVVVDGSAPHLEHLAFRDRLRSSPLEADDYGEIKKQLARAHGVNRTAYTDAKGKFIERVLSHRP